MILLDTNIIIYYLKSGADVVKWLDKKREDEETFAISTLSIVELLSFPNITSTELFLIERWLNTILVIDLDASIAREAARLRRLYKLNTADSIVAATAAILNSPLASRDGGFKKISDIELLIP